MFSPQVTYCGYTIPHPSENKIHLRIQTDDSITAVQALEQGLDDLKEMCTVVLDKFQLEVKRIDLESSMDTL